MTNVGIKLTEGSPAVRRLHGGASWVVSGGGRIKIQIKESKNEPMSIVINERVPTGKKWEASVTIVIAEAEA